PLSITIVAYQSVGEEPMRRAVIGLYALTPLLSSWNRLRRRAFSCAAPRSVTSWRYSWLRSLVSDLTLALAWIVTPAQPKKSRNGLGARLAPSWIGETTSRTPRCTACRPPPGDSPK